MDASNPSKLRRSSRLKAAKVESVMTTMPSNSPQQQPRNQRKIKCAQPIQRVQRDRTHIFCLSPEVLTHIFRLLPVQDLARVARVSTAWKDIVYQKLFWSDVTITLDQWPAELNDANLLKDSLLLRGIEKLMTREPTVLEEITRSIPDLRCVTLKRFKVPSVKWTSRLVQQMTNLTLLNLKGAYVVTDSTIQLVAKHLKKMISLNLDGCAALTDRSLQHIAMGLPELKHLDLSSCNRISDKGLGYLSGFKLKPPAPKLPQLEALNLYSCSACTDLAIHHLSRGQPNIQWLSLSELDLSDAVFQWLATFKELRHLDISDTSVTGSGLVELANVQSPITHLRMFRCHLTHEALEHVSRLKKLHELSFEVCNKGLTHLANGQSPVAIVRCRGDVTNVGLRHLARLSNLHSLDLSECDRITDAGLKKFVANVRGSVSELRLCSDYHLHFCNGPILIFTKHMSYCEGLGAGTLSYVSRGLPALTTLWLSSSQVNEEGLDAAARLLPQLHSFFVNAEDGIDEVRRQYDGNFFQSMLD